MNDPARARTITLAIAATALGFMTATALASPAEIAVTADDFKEERVYSPYAGRAYPDQVFFGDTPFHTKLSPDAGLIGTTLSVEDGYRFARGTNVELRSEIVSWKTGVEREVLAFYETDGRASLFDISREQAERVMLDLKDKLGVGLEFAVYPALTHADAEVISALTSLGYSIAEAQAALRSLPKEDLSLEERIRLSLQYFAGE